ncbi:hypothetical protein CKM354_000777700 [Cercospora kikuchii]|uniref:Uncharacterized protein n=1 Tax=Cercospora kikuchii TaxID=84275 RepID=A0A9P3FEN1_9PEZI|nr:uncharacterized protein CKM354_000777700 [Cercospora kikuchii]GIZ44583.1 hypothetical protein CKM354_000777700 [Cercospora kikuchii]
MPLSASREPYANWLPAEIIKHVLSYLQPPSPEAPGRARYEHIEFADERAEAVNQFTAASQKICSPS